jgi:hypothetical protein
LAGRSPPNGAAGAYLGARDWIEAHAVQIKPKTLQDYRHLIR